MKVKSLFFFILASILLLGSCKKDEEEPDKPTPPYYPNGIGEIGTIGGTVAMDDENSPFFGAKVVIPEGALDAPVEIEIRIAPDEIQLPGDTSTKVFEFLPSGTQFNKPVTITLPFEGDSTNLAIHEYFPDTDGLEKLLAQSVDIEESRISAQTSHFSYYSAWFSWFYIPINVFRTDDGRIATTFSVNGLESPNLGPNYERGWEYIPTRTVITQWTSAYDVLMNQSGLVMSQFEVILYAYSDGNYDVIDELEYSINRPDVPIGLIAEFIDDHSSNEPSFYTSPILTEEDYTSENVNMDNAVLWFSGKPVVVIFDEFQTDSDEEYYVGVRWSLNRTSLLISRLTPELALSNFDDKKSFSELEFRPRSEFDNDPADGILDEFQTGQNDSPPSADFEFSPANPEILQEVQFTNLTQNGESYTWLFGDGTTIYNEENPTHTYTSVGTYDVVLTAGNNNGDDQIVKSITVSEPGEEPDYPPGTVHCIEGGTEVVEVINPETGRTWMDRNLGASQVAASSGDQSAYGDLYQWGRFSDGHQCRNSSLAYSLSTSIDVAHGNFILATTSPYDWLTSQNDNLWTGGGGLTNPCPQEYRLPSIAEWDAELNTWSSSNREGAFNSVLKLPAAGKRLNTNGSLDAVNFWGYYWSSTTSTFSESTMLGQRLLFDPTLAYTNENVHAFGHSVRCIKD